MRGTLCVALWPWTGAWIIPAYAGNTCYSYTEASIAGGSSPHMRGTHVFLIAVIVAAGIIPAYAGNTLRDYSNFVVSKFMSFVFHLV